MTNEEMKKINIFRNTSIPYIFKNDKTDSALFLEKLDFDICERLQNKKSILNVEIKDIINEYSKFSQNYYIGLNHELDSYLLLVKEVIDILKKDKNLKQWLFKKHFNHIFSAYYT